jgi:hypothetical protein
MLGYSSGGILDRKEHGPNPRIMQIMADQLLDGPLGVFKTALGRAPKSGKDPLRCPISVARPRCPSRT